MKDGKRMCQYLQGFENLAGRNFLLIQRLLKVDLYQQFLLL